MVHPDRNERPSAEEALNTLAGPILGTSTQYILFYNYVLRRPEFSLPDFRQLFRLCFLDFLQKEGFYGGLDNYSLDLKANYFFVKSMDSEYFFELLQRITSECPLFSRQKTKELGGDSQDRSFESVSKEFPANMDPFSRDQTMLSLVDADRVQPQFLSRFGEHLAKLAGLSHAVVKHKYHTLPSFQNVVSSLEHEKTRSTSENSSPESPGSSGNYYKNMEALIVSMQSTFKVDGCILSTWPESLPSDPQFPALDLSASLTDPVPAQAPRVFNQLLLNELLRDLTFCHYREILGSALDISHQLAPLVDPTFLVMSAFPLVQSLFKKPCKISPLKLFRSFIRLCASVETVPSKMLCSLNALQDYLLEFVDKIFHSKNPLLLSELVRSLGKINQAPS